MFFMAFSGSKKSVLAVGSLPLKQSKGGKARGGIAVHAHETKKEPPSPMDDLHCDLVTKKAANGDPLSDIVTIIIIHPVNINFQDDYLDFPERATSKPIKAAPAINPPTAPLTSVF